MLAPAASVYIVRLLHLRGWVEHRSPDEKDLVCVSLSLSNYAGTASPINLPALGIGALDLFLMQKFKLGVPWIIGISAALGLLFFGVLGL